MPGTTRRPRNVPIRIRKNHIWVSELPGLIIAVTTLVSLAVMIVIVFVNDVTLQRNNAIIPLVRNERVIATHTLNELRQKIGIAAVLDTFSRGRISEEVRWMLTELVHTNSKTYGYDPLLVLAVIHVESLFDPRALGQYRDGTYSGALGLMQLKTETAKEVADALGIPFTGRDDLFSPEINIPLGIAYLTRQISAFQSLKLGILAYNQGPGFVKTTLRNRAPLSIRYYNKVLTSYYTLKKMAAGK